MARRLNKQSKFSPQNYYRSPAPDQTKPSREQRRIIDQAQAKRIGGLVKILLIVVMIAGTWYFGFVDGAKVESSGGGDSQALELALEQRLGGWRSFKPLINPGQLSEQIMTADSTIAQLNLSWALGSRQLRAGVVYRRPVGDALSNRQNVGLIDQAGIFYEGANSEDLPPIEDTSGLTPTVGQQFVPIRTLNFIRQIEQSIASLPQDIQTSRRYLLVESSREVQLASSRSFVVKLNVERAAADQMQELAETLKFLKAKKRTPTDYIDLRVDDTAYYQ